jgi:EF-hand domain pair
MSKPVVQGSFNLLTRTRAFRKITKWAFSQCDSDGTGQVGKAELHTGILLVHIQLAKYAGAAACYPPTRQVIDQLFDAADDNKSGTVDEEEFTQIVLICCAKITSRILVYYAIIILLVPYVADRLIRALLGIDDWLGWTAKPNNVIVNWFEKVLTCGEVAEKIISLALFFLIVPMLFDWIDSLSRRAAEMTEARQTETKKAT